MKAGVRLPDFIIGGAMKSATTTLHHIMASHERVFMPLKELFFFDIDDFEQHRNFFVPFGSRWNVHDYDRDFDKNLLWYSSFFKEASEGVLLGEDTTTYLASRKAPARIARLLPHVKLIFLLRNPVARAYSQYWHMVGKGSMTYTFEQALRYDPSTILQRGHYREQLARYLEFFDRKQIKVVVFEHFVKNLQATVDDVCDFLGLSSTVDTRSVNLYMNRTSLPRFRRMQLTVNRGARVVDSRRYLLHTMVESSRKGGEEATRWGDFSSLLKRFVKKIVFDDRAPVPPMKRETSEFLGRYYRMENRGIEDLVGQDLKTFWRYMEE